MFYQNIIDREKVGQLLKESIVRMYGSISEYARQTGQEYKKVHSWTSGKRLPELEDIVATCNILEIPLEYALVGTNRCFKKFEETEDEYADIARYTYPNLIFVDAALLFPLIGMKRMMDLVYRAGECSDSHYVYKLFRRYMQIESDEWKYCVYVLQQRNSPLVDKIKKLEPVQEEIEKWSEEYYKKRKEFFLKCEIVENMIYQISNIFSCKII